MTQIRFNPKPRWRESNVITRDRGRIRQILVAAEPDSLLIRLKGTRGVLRLPYGVAYTRAAVLAADQVRRDRKEAKRKGKPAAMTAPR